LPFPILQAPLDTESLLEKLNVPGALTTQFLDRAPSVTEADVRRMHLYRNERVRAELRRRDYAAGLFCDAINVRYATGSRNMQVWTLRNPARYVLVTADGPTIMFEFGGCDHLVQGLETIQEIRRTTSWFYFTSGPRIAEHAKVWAAEIADSWSSSGGNVARRSTRIRRLRALRGSG
jgi:Xaa-Pro aminopeptidase